jgi:hypothetical protein
MGVLGNCLREKRDGGLEAKNYTCLIYPFYLNSSGEYSMNRILCGFKLLKHKDPIALGILFLWMVYPLVRCG